MARGRFSLKQLFAGFQRQDDTTNTEQLRDVKIQFGRGRVTATTGSDTAEAVTFAEAFTERPIVICNFIGYANASSAWTDTPNDSWGGMTFSAQNPSTTGFTARGRRNDGATLITTLG